MSKILLIDDDLRIRKLYKDELEEEGCEVITAATGREGQEVFKREHKTIDLVLLDILLPDIDGISILKWIKEEKPEKPVIIVSAYDYRDDFAAWVSDDYIIKSSDLTELKCAARKLLKISG